MITINLLPRKKPFFTAVHIILAGIGLGWVAGALALGVSYYATEEKISLLQQEIKMKETGIATMQKKAATVQHHDSLDQYLLLSERMQHLFLPTTLLLDEVARNLPEQGKINSISYNLSGSIELAGSFEQYEDIAAYLHNLQLSPYVMKAEIKNIKTSKIEWQGPVDEQGEPMSPSLRTLGGEILPRFIASFEIKAITVDQEKLAAHEQASVKKKVEEKK